jgi:hypothetical protein
MFYLNVKTEVTKYLVNNFMFQSPKMTWLPLVRFQVVTTTSMKMAVFWDVTPCLVDFDRRFRGPDGSLTSIMNDGKRSEGNQSRLILKNFPAFIYRD